MTEAPRRRFRKLLRSLRKAHEDMERSAGDVTVHSDCPECGSRNAVEFKDIQNAQTRFYECWKCGETIRVRTAAKD